MAGASAPGLRWQLCWAAADSSAFTFAPGQSRWRGELSGLCWAADRGHGSRYSRAPNTHRVWRRALVWVVYAQAACSRRDLGENSFSFASILNAVTCWRLVFGSAIWPCHESWPSVARSNTSTSIWQPPPHPPTLDSPSTEICIYKTESIFICVLIMTSVLLVDIFTTSVA